MKKKFTFISVIAAFSAFTVAADFMLPSPKIIKEEIGEGKVNIAWEYSSEDVPEVDYQVIVYKKHTAKSNEEFVIAETDFDYIESVGTINKQEDTGMLWDYVPDCPGWFVRAPLYMNGAMGIDTFFYYVGSDNDDIFGAAYMVSPDIDISHLSKPVLKIDASLGKEASSVTNAGFAVYMWNTDWYTASNADYVTLKNHDHNYDTIALDKFKSYSEVCDLSSYINDPWEPSRTRVCFYGWGKSAYWIDSFRVAADMKAGDSVNYGSSFHNVGKEKSFTIDTSEDTDSDKVIGYEVRAIYWEPFTSPRDGIERMTIRFMSPSLPMKVIGVDNSGIGSVENDNFKAPVEYYSLQGVRLAEPVKGQIVIVRRGSESFKTIVR